MKKAKNQEDKNVIKFHLALTFFKSKDYDKAYEFLKELENTSLKSDPQRFLTKVFLAFSDLKHIEKAKAILESLMNLQKASLLATSF